MSMSALGSQLAALSSSSTSQKGLAVSSTRDTTQSIGRGFAHSSKAGHALRTNDVRSRASILYDSAREAADVTTVTLQENAIAALEGLAAEIPAAASLLLSEEFVGNEGLLSVHRLKYERGTSTSAANAEVDKSVCRLLDLMGTVAVQTPPPPGDDADLSDNPTLISALSVIEYLIRQYQIHANHLTAGRLLYTLLPLQVIRPTAYPGVFGRVLSLVDLQELGLTFLRPFAARQAPPATRSILARQASKDAGLAAEIVRIGLRASEIHAEEMKSSGANAMAIDGDGEGGDYGEARRGTSALISASASVLAEAVYLQSRSKEAGLPGGPQEKLAQVLFPQVVSAVRSKTCGEWKGWGRVLAASLARTCPLSTEVRTALCDALVDGMECGAAGSKTDFQTAAEHLAEGGEEGLTSAQLDDASSAVAALLAVLGTMSSDAYEGYLPLLSGSSKVEEYLGCELPASTYGRLRKKGVASVAAVLGAMVEEDEDGGAAGRISPLVATLSARGAVRLGSEAEKTAGEEKSKSKKKSKKKNEKKEDKCKADRDVLLILSLVNEASLEPVWSANCSSLIAAATAHIATSYGKLAGRPSGLILGRYKSAMEALASANSGAHDRGVARAVATAAEDGDLARLAELVGREVSEAKAKSGVKDSDDMVPSDLLPPRVAVESADASVRLEAVRRLGEEIESHNNGGESVDDDLGRALLRRIASDDDEGVAMAAGAILVRELETLVAAGKRGETALASLLDDLEALAEGALDAARRWPKGDEEDSAASLCLKICGSAVLLIQREVPMDEIDEDGDDRLVNQLCALVVTVGAGAESDNSVPLDLPGVCNVASRYRQWSAEISPLVPGGSPARFLGFAIASYWKVVSKLKKKDGSVTGALDLIAHWMELAGDAGDSLDEQLPKTVAKLCTKCLSLLAKDEGDDLKSAIVKLASTKSKSSFNGIVEPAILSLAPSTALLLRVCVHPGSGTEAILRILAAMAWRDGNKMDANAAQECIIPGLALLTYPNRKVREAAVGVFELLSDVKKDAVVSAIGSAVADDSSPMRSALVMDGPSVLPRLLGQMASSDAKGTVRQLLLKGCGSSTLVGHSGLSAGGCGASSVVLSSMEKAGEQAFPLLQRWEVAGRDLFERLRGAEDGALGSKPSVCQLRDCVMSMMKGVIVNEAQAGEDGVSIQINDGPSSMSGRRSRSYSVGSSDKFTTISPYPESMLQAILNTLTSSGKSDPLLMNKKLSQLVLTRQSWSNGVFPKLSSKMKESITSALLALRSHHNEESAGLALIGLPLTASGLNHLLKGISTASEDGQAALVFVNDCILTKVDLLGNIADISKLSGGLFDHLLSLSSSSHGGSDSGGRDYTRVSTVQSLLAIHSQYKGNLKQDDGHKSQTKSKRKRSRSHSDVGNAKTIAAQADTLVGIIGGSPTIEPLSSARGQVLALSLLSCLCEEAPSSIVSSLLHALKSLAVSKGDSQSSILGEALGAILPAYCEHAPSAGLSLVNLLESLVGQVILSGDANIVTQHGILDNAVEALKSLPTKENSSDAVASLIACAMSLQAFKVQQPAGDDEEDSTMPDAIDEVGEHTVPSRLDVMLLEGTSSAIKIAVSLSLLQYAEYLLMFICGNTSNDSTQDAMRAKPSEVAALALTGQLSKDTVSYSACNETQKRTVMLLSINMIQTVRDVLSTPAARRLVRKSKGEEAELCLRLWNELMQTHTNTLRAHAKLVVDDELSPAERRFWDAAPKATGECLECLQNLLPVPHFLASMSNALLDEQADAYILKKSMRLLANRVTDMDTDSPESLLFLDMVPDLVSLVTSDGDAAEKEAITGNRRNIMLKQGALMAIESFVRALYPSTDKSRLASTMASIFLPALSSLTKFMDKTARGWIKDLVENEESEFGDAECQLLSSLSLCISSLIMTLKAKCLPHLPSILKPLLKSLQSVNVLMDNAGDGEGIRGGDLLQLSIVKTLSAVANTLPQFIPPYLDSLLSEDTLPSPTLHGEDKDELSVNAAAVELETALATKVPIRQLIMPLFKGATRCLETEGTRWKEAISMFGMLKVAIDSTERSALAPVVGKIFNCLVLAYGYQGDSEARMALLQIGNKCLLALVMKLSESQLRPLYARFREWRGDIKDVPDSNESAIRRHAFWSLSAQLSRTLRSIFLPCTTSVISDIIDELEIAVSTMGSKFNETKKRRIEVDTESLADTQELLPLQPLLLFLELTFRADAHEGGDWTRGDDNQRYNMISNHLAKLLLAQVPKELDILTDSVSKQSSASSYQKLVQGVGTSDHGNVVGCLASLATAAGNEQLWKPLNLALLEACSHKRTEVRKTGISCLLSIIDTIGEEYMVLLPECLPVLSELLEDEEEIAGMAKECVRQSEELLGESLEESLR